MRSTFAVAAMLSVAAVAEKVKFGVLSDIHLQVNYRPDKPAEGAYCCSTGEGKTDDLAYFGRFGCDLPPLMVDRAFEKFSTEHNDLDFILVPGDFVGHAISLDYWYPVSFKESQESYAQLKSVHRDVSDLFEKYFENVPVLMTLGNNDTKYHYQPPFGLNEQRFFQFMDEVWFTDHTGNQKLDNLDEISESIGEGGYYRVNLIPGKLTLLSIDSLPFNSSNYQKSEDVCDAMLNWLEAQFSGAGPDEKFLTMMHIYETASYWEGVNTNWKEDIYQQRYFKLLEQYRDKIVFEVTGHDHLSGLRTATVDGTTDEYYLNKVVFPGLTSATFQQPGYATFTYDTETGKAADLKMTFVNIQNSVGLPSDTPYSSLKWLDVDYSTFDLEDLSGAQIADLASRLDDDHDKARQFQLSRMGVDPGDQVQLDGALLAYQDKYGQACPSATADDMFDDGSDFVVSYCLMTNSRTKKEFEDCIKAQKELYPCKSSSKASKPLEILNI